MSDITNSLITYQLHSRNDLREWNALFRKGATCLKIDPHYMVDSDRFILSHDRPWPWRYAHSAYHSLDDVLVYFQHPPPYLYGKDITIALCFKKAPLGLCHMSHSETVKHWMTMAEQFFAQANRVVAHIQRHFNITLTFLLDGDAKPCSCLADKFLPWNSVWIDQKQDRCSRTCYHSNEGVCQRFTVLNDPAKKDWVGMAAPDNHYGKFGLYNHSLQVWEPDSQSKIGTLIQNYLTGREQGVPSGTGLKFAINMDVAHFDVFTSRTLKGANARGFNLLLSSKDGATNKMLETNPSLVYQGPGEMLLQYTTSPRSQSSAKTQRVQQKVTITPFTDIQIGSPELIPNPPDRTELPLALLSKAYIDRYVRIHRHVTADEITSWSAQPVGDYEFVFVAVQGKVYASVQHDENVDSTDFRLIGLGTTVHASSFNDTLLLVTEGNHCYNSHAFNTRSAPLLCERLVDPHRHACPFMLDYSVGTAQNWLAWLSSGHQTVITPCNEFILHGTFSGGTNPSGSLFPIHNNNGKIGVMVAHEPYPESKESPCGTPIKGESGIVISSFATTLVQDRYTPLFRVQDPGALESIGPFSGSGPLKIGLLLALLVCGPLTVRWMRRRAKRMHLEEYQTLRTHVEHTD